MNTTKWIITSKSGLQLKYGANFKKIGPLVNKLIVADKKRGIITRLLYIDDSTSATAAGIAAVKNTMPKDCKTAVDALYKKHTPDYIVLLGSQDIFPFQSIDNPTDDDDSDIPSDLPYACEHGYSRNIANFTGPTRCVGRIPDVPGKNDISYFTKLINNIIAHKPIKDDFYRNYFAVSAEVWQKSTMTSLQSMFGHHKNLLLSPVAAPKNGYEKKQLAPLAHFINCHGALADTKFYGQRGNDYPVALDANHLTGNVATGTVVAAECCYGAELINPNNSEDSKTMSIANAYLHHNSLAFLGSSTIAYGPADGQGQADLITQYFINNIINGASSGRALLEARQKFLSVSGPHLDPVDLKTIAQFYLLGDPSIVPVADSTLSVTGKAIGNTVRNRRNNLMMKGLNLPKTVAAAKKVGTPAAGRKQSEPLAKTFAATATESKDLKQLLKTTGFLNADTKAVYTVANPVSNNGPLAKTMFKGNTMFRTFTKKDKVELDVPGSKTGTSKKVIINKDSVLVVKEDGQSILRWRVYVCK